jgi:competence protein ComEC
LSKRCNTRGAPFHSSQGTIIDHRGDRILPTGVIDTLSMRSSLFIMSLFLFGCIDTTPMTIEEMNQQLGGGPTDGPICSSYELEDFPPETLRMHVIDVGQGDAIWIQTPWEVDLESESHNILIDTGGAGDHQNSSPGGDIVVDYMLRRGLEFGDALDAVVVTHAHEDHYGGLPVIASAFLIRRYSDPGGLIGTSGFLTARQSAITEVLAGGGAIDSPAADTLVSSPFANVDLFGNRVSAQLLWAREQSLSGNVENLSGTDVNNTSVVFAIQWPPKGNPVSRQILLMGDLETAGEEQLLLDAASAGHPLGTHVLKVGHHGSSTSSGDSFLTQALPVEDPNRWAVISSGRQPFGSNVTLPTPETIARLSDRLSEYHLLSTANRDEEKEVGDEHDDDHVIFTITAEGTVTGCYAP